MAAEIVAGPSVQAYPSNEVYITGQDGVSITDGSGRCGSGADATNYSYLLLQIALPSQVSFDLGALTDYWSDTSLDTCGFPDCAGSWPACLLTFLSQLQPQPKYRNVYFLIATAGCEDNRSSDFRTMAIGTSLRAGLTLRIDPENSGADCQAGCPGEHSVWFKARGYEWALGQPDIYIYRDSATVWTVHVSTNFDNPAYQSGNSWPYRDAIFEKYCTCTLKTGKGGKSYWATEYFDSAWAKTHLEFQIKFTKVS